MTSDDPFRTASDDAVVFELRSSLAYVAGVVASVIAGGWLVGVGVSMLVDGRPPLLGAIAIALGLSLPLGKWSSRATYLVPSGRGQLRLHDDRIEYVTAKHRVVLATRDLVGVGVRYRVRMLVGFIPTPSFDTDGHLELRTNERALVLSPRLFRSRADFDAAVAAIRRLVTPAPDATAAATRGARSDVGVDRQHGRGVAGLGEGPSSFRAASSSTAGSDSRRRGARSTARRMRCSAP